jgi:nitroimidazol reductase NimA-like FMN-containing flavoprotein (pyridoxamine 5'-phosphate oxidase superfamily)
MEIRMVATRTRVLTIHGRYADAGADEEAPGMNNLTEDDCWRLLSLADVARIAVVTTEDLEIFPVNIAVDGPSIIFRTAEGTKLAATTTADRVVVEVDGFDADKGVAWSVVVKGDAEAIESRSDIARIQKLPLHSWHEGFKDRFVRVRPGDVQGRRFKRVTHDDDDH